MLCKVILSNVATAFILAQYFDIKYLFCETRRIEVSLKSWDLVELVTLLPGGFCRRTRSPHTLPHFPIPGFTAEATRKVQEIDPLETAISWLPKGSQSNMVD